MLRNLFLLIVGSLMTVAMSPAILTATDEVAVTRVSDAKAVETVVPEPEPEPVQTVAKAPAAGYAPKVAAPVNYTVSYYVGSEQEYVDTAANLSYSMIYKFAKMVYGHNSYNLLGNLAGRAVGETITITEGGVTQSYVVTAKAYYDKTADGYLNGDPYLMGDIAYTAMGHDLAIMTCAGQMLAGGDATQRLVVYADAI